MTSGIAHETPQEGPWHSKQKEKIQIPTKKEFISPKSGNMPEEKEKPVANYFAYMRHHTKDSRKLTPMYWTSTP